MRTRLELPVSGSSDDVHKHAAPLMHMHKIAAVQVLFQPRQHSVAQRLVGMRLHYLHAVTPMFQPTQTVPPESSCPLCIGSKSAVEDVPGTTPAE